MADDDQTDPSPGLNQINNNNNNNNNNNDERQPDCNIRTIQTHGMAVWLQQIALKKQEEAALYRDRVVDTVVERLERFAPEVSLGEREILLSHTP